MGAPLLLELLDPDAPEGAPLLPSTGVSSSVAEVAEERLSPPPAAADGAAAAADTDDEPFFCLVGDERAMGGPRTEEASAASAPAEAPLPPVVAAATAWVIGRGSPPPCGSRSRLSRTLLPPLLRLLLLRLSLSEPMKDEVEPSRWERLGRRTPQLKLSTLSPCRGVNKASHMLKRLSRP